MFRELLTTHVHQFQECMSECAQLEDFDEQLYKVWLKCLALAFGSNGDDDASWLTVHALLQVSGEGDEKYLIATSEQTLCSMLRHKWIDPKECPMRLAGYSTCFRKEVRPVQYACLVFA